MKFLGLLVLVNLFLMSCGPISVNRSYVDEMDDRGKEYLVAGQNFDAIPGDTGNHPYAREDMMKRTPSRHEDYPEWSEEQKIQKELNKKISKLSEEQKLWFNRNEHLLGTDSQKIYFLSLSHADREEYLSTISSKRIRGHSGRRRPASNFRYSPRANREVYLGMGKDEVSGLWGNPHKVDVAGNPRLENERWTFYENGRKKYIYFAQGRVEGWVTE